MKRKALCITLAGVMIMSPLLIEIVNAETLDSIQKQQNEVREQQKQANEQINEIQVQSNDLESEIEKLNKNIIKTRESIQKKQIEIEQQRKEIDRLNEDVQTLNEQIDRRAEVLRNRAVSLQRNGGSISYIQVLLGSQSFSDFIGRAGAINELLNADRNIIEQQASDLLLVEQKEKKALKQQDAYEKRLEELQALEGSLQEQSAQKEKILAELASRKQEIKGEIHELERQEEFLKEQEAAIKKAAEEAAQNNNSRGNMPAITDGLFMRPANGPVTSEFGMRTLNGTTRLHAGIDIGRRGTNVPVVAAADGVVIRSDFSSSFGNVVFITHNLNGKIYTTVYAHLENRVVRTGETVRKGQKLGLMGNTGHSFGAHLHFELHRGQWNGQSNAVNPRKYINF